MCDEELVECVEHRLSVCKSKIKEIKAKCEQKLSGLTLELLDDKRLNQAARLIIAERAHASVSKFKIELNLLLELADDELSKAPDKITQSVRQILDAQSFKLNMPMLEDANDEATDAIIEEPDCEVNLTIDDHDDSDSDIQILSYRKISPSPASQIKNSIIELDLEEPTDKNAPIVVKTEETNVALTQKQNHNKKQTYITSHFNKSRKRRQLEQSSPIPSKRPRLSPQSANENNTNHNNNNSNNSEAPEVVEISDVSNIEHSSPKNTSISVPVSSSAVSDEKVEENENNENNEDNENSNKPKKKRGRGRPRKNTVAESATVSNSKETQPSTTQAKICQEIEQAKKQYEVARNAYTQRNSYWNILQSPSHHQEVFNRQWPQVFRLHQATHTYQQIYSICQQYVAMENEAEKRRVGQLLQQYKLTMDAAKLRVQQLHAQLQAMQNQKKE